MSEKAARRSSSRLRRPISRRLHESPHRRQFVGVAEHAPDVRQLNVQARRIEDLESGGHLLELGDVVLLLSDLGTERLPVALERPLEPLHMVAVRHPAPQLVQRSELLLECHIDLLCRGDGVRTGLRQQGDDLGLRLSEPREVLELLKERCRLLRELAA
jgi:hypothetical protein